MTKPLAQVLYETYSATFDIGIQGDHKGGKVSHGPSPWHQLPVMDQHRWAAVARMAKSNVLGTLDPFAAFRNLVASDPSGPTQCKCGARHLKGENHVCNDKVKNT